MIARRPLLTAFVFLGCVAMACADTPKVPVVIDTDIGSDIDDAFALGLAVASPELDIRAITTSGSQAEDRAWMVCRFLTHADAPKVPPIAFGRGTQPEEPIDWQIQYRRHPAPIFNRTVKPAKETAVEVIYKVLKDEPGKVTILALGPLTNVAALLKEHADAKDLIKRVILRTGGANLDVPAARAVLEAGVPLLLVPSGATEKLRLDAEQRERLFAAYTLLTMQVQCLYELWDKQTPELADPLVVALAFDQSFCKFEDSALAIDDKGLALVERKKAPYRVVTSVREEAFLKWFVDRLRSFGKQSLPEPPKNLSTLIERGKFPARVHTFEDYDTDIEKRWWMSGKAETKDVPPGGRRAQRAVLTQDFDDRQGNMKTMYRAVIFNPVPGPPMGKNTRLSFRYKLHGTDRLRVQLYSLTNGYHRYLSLKDLPQDEWRSGTADMTKMRRPDGTGGALSEKEDERIDDIQFYIDPRAELLIDDVVLCEAAVEGETRPFPERFLFTGWFDTGAQGKEWPGDFQIVPHEKPRTWKAAKSVENKETRTPWIRLYLRGDRRLGPTTELSFRYHLTGADGMRVELGHAKTKLALGQDLKDLKMDTWAEATLRFPAPVDKNDPKKEFHVDEVRFLLPKGAMLLIDDVLLYVPGSKGG